MITSMELNTNIVGVYTSPPSKITETRQSYKISLSNNTSTNHTFNKNIMQKRTHIILFYQNQNNEDSGWHIGGWIKASLGNALSDHLILAGRFQRSEDGNLDIVSNDSGVRCVEAKVAMSLVDFLRSKGTNNGIERGLIYWEDVDESNLEFSSLFCIQVTNFSCGGYSIGISCHLLLADTSFMVKFLNKWAENHRSIAYEGKIHKITWFNTQNMKQNCYYSNATKPISNSSAKKSKTMCFDIFTYEKFKSRDEICNFFVLLCLEEVESKFGNKISSTFTLLTRESNGDAKIVISSKQALFGSPKNMKYEFNTLDLDDLEMNEIAFLNGNGPIDTSLWISCDVIEALVVVVILAPIENKFGMKVYVTFPRV